MLGLVQFRSGHVKLYLVMSCYNRFAHVSSVHISLFNYRVRYLSLGHLLTCYFMLGQFTSGFVRHCQVRSNSYWLICFVTLV
jgi:hypothetical protein